MKLAIVRQESHGPWRLAALLDAVPEYELRGTYVGQDVVFSIVTLEAAREDFDVKVPP